MPRDTQAEQYAQALANLASATHTSPQGVQTALARIYPELRAALAGGSPPAWWERVLGNTGVWTTKDCFEPAAFVLIPDDEELCRLFASKVHLAWCPAGASVLSYRALYDALHVRSLAEEVTASLLTAAAGHSELSQCPLLTPAARVALCAFLWNELPDEYRRAKEGGSLPALLGTQEYEVERVAVRYAVDAWEVTAPDCSAFWDREGQHLYVAGEMARELVEADLPLIIARAVVSPPHVRRVADFLGRVLGASEAKWAAIRQRYAYVLSEEEQLWIEGLLRRPSDLEPPNEAPQPPTEVSQPAPPAAPTGSEREARPYTSPGGGSTWPRNGVGYRAGPTGRGGSPGGSPHRQERLRSYVYEESSEEGADRDAEHEPQRQREIDEAGMRAVCAYERSHRRTPQPLGDNHPGWDIDSRDEDGSLVRRIEVKSLGGAWGLRGVGLSRRQYEASRDLPEHYYLYVVEHALDPSRQRIYVFANPFARISDYRIDDGWRAAADEVWEAEVARQD